MTQWRDRIITGYAARAHEKRPEFSQGASSQRLAALEHEVGLRIPTALRELLTESDGVNESLRIRDEWMVIHAPVWTCEEIAAENQAIRKAEPTRPEPSETPEARPFYFADAGVDGVVFAFAVCPSGPEDPAVYAYYPIESKWRRVSPSLEAHLHGWKI